ncbi:hypothetical protein K402DRAFT_429348 [Aulographum hederae CBS 113979]|uniref:Xylanolytic transcriptional activator regulatory domain-containing protein n=1 Tax=Aulographum hederae CBS 113979 TaxID=1176131 RepID=A0A6G1H2E0_9PEZI|nr:hypothetical protein K402DRAFT_429348 [Aulographum hederae CBS 113979]
MSSIITFPLDSETFRKRKRVHKACEPCKKIRKRCNHTFSEHAPSVEAVTSSHDGEDASRALSVEETVAAAVARRDSDEEEQRTTNRDAIESTPPRFLGYLNPEAVLREHVKNHFYQDQCGYWISSNDQNSNDSAIDEPGITSHRIDRPQSKEVERALMTYLHASGVTEAPPPHHQETLVKVYMDYVHPILPILDRSEFERKYRKGVQSLVLLQAMWIIASKHDKARPHLVLREGGPLEPRDFAKRLYSAVTTALAANMETDRLVLIQSLALMSLYYEGHDGALQASMHLTQAIHHAHTIGLQFDQSNKHPKSDYLKRLFWCLWSLDRMNGCINGRPLVIHDRDNQNEKLTSDPQQRHTAFGVWLQISETLDNIMPFYRPNNDPACTGWEDPYPSFESMVGEDQLDPPILAALELYYHAVAMLSHKSESVRSSVRRTSSYDRQSLSAVRVIQILTKECPTDLPPLPVVPYALSLSMSVAYRQIRQSKLHVHRARAKDDLKVCCDLLEKMKPIWWSAGVIAELGRAALVKASSDVNTRSHHLPSHTNEATSANGDTAGVHRRETVRLTTPLGPGSLPAAVSDDTPDWLNFDTAFGNMDTLLGTSGVDLEFDFLNSLDWNHSGNANTATLSGRL